MPFLPWRNCSELSHELPYTLKTTSSAFVQFFSGVQILHSFHYFKRDATGMSLPTHLCPGPSLAKSFDAVTIVIVK